jgi:imidazoleglycerol phosphate dehydratase HisB
LRDHLDPTIHLEQYERDVTMRLHCGADDHHVPEANARAFADAVSVDARIEIVEHAGLDHFGVCTDQAALDDCFVFLTGD